MSITRLVVVLVFGTCVLRGVQLEKFGQLLASADGVRKQLARLHAAAARARPEQLAQFPLPDKAPPLPRGPGTLARSASESARDSAGEKGRRLGLELEMARLADDAAATTQAVFIVVYYLFCYVFKSILPVRMQFYFYGLVCTAFAFCFFLSHAAPLTLLLRSFFKLSCRLSSS